ncbi:MAG: D-alanine--D-alanine ligase [Firmicutes bacterium]|nr:D-alanine--D-alanine ligase [Bacillota bacterium]
MNPKIGILMGGRSAEREVSLRTGEAIYQALVSSGFTTEKIDVGFDIAEQLKEKEIELAFIALHGRFGEDGTIQGLLEMLDIPYTGSGVLASALAIDKIATKKILSHEGLPTPVFSVIEKKRYQKEGQEKITGQILAKQKLPLVVKAPTQGSSIGTSFVRDIEELKPALEEAFKFDPVALVEDMVEGTEVTASVLGNEDPVALPLIEIYSASGVYDYEAKYTVGLSDHIMPPRIPDKQQEAIKEMAVKTFKALGCRGLARVDFIVDSHGESTILEVNTIPGMTETSLYPDAARAAGISFEDLTAKLVNLAMER